MIDICQAPIESGIFIQKGEQMKSRRRLERGKQKNILRICNGLLAILTVILIVVLINIDKFAEQKIATSVKEEPSTVQETITEEPTTIDNTLYKVSFLAVGDNLVSDSVTHCGLQSDGSYEFSELFEELKPDIQAADLAVINQETILGGPDFEYTGYPNFNNPFEVGDAVIDAGFDLALCATNHSYDMGVQGIKNSLKYWKKHPEITMIGMNKNAKQQNKINIIEKNNIKIAVLNYTYGLNGYSLPEGQEYLVNLIEEEKIKSDLQRAEEMADFTIVFPHWGVEYVHEPNEEQRELAMMMVENGADLIVGTHPHVLETIEWVKADNGNKALCYYSLGNYTSSQDKTSTMLGGMAKLTIAKKGNKVWIKKGAGIVPIVTHYIWGEGRITKTYRINEYTEALAAVHSIHTVTSDFSIEKLNEIAETVVGDWIIE